MGVSSFDPDGERKRTSFSGMSLENHSSNALKRDWWSFQTQRHILYRRYLETKQNKEKGKGNRVFGRKGRSRKEQEACCNGHEKQTQIAASSRGLKQVAGGLELLTAKAPRNRRQQSRVQSVLCKGSGCAVTVKGHNTGKRKR